MQKQKQPDASGIVAEIHEDFSSAEERILQQAKTILSTAVEKKKVDSKSERARKLGFSKSLPAVLPGKISEKQAAAKELQQAINYFREKYPFNKFITDDEVEKLCNKWGLVVGPASAYTGDIPEKNLKTIEKFELKKEDWLSNNSMSIFGRMDPAENVYRLSKMFAIDPSEIEVSFSRGSGRGLSFSAFERGYATIPYGEYIFSYRGRTIEVMSERDMYSREEKQKPAFKIVAPQKDFDMTNKELKGHVIDEKASEIKMIEFFVDDPIVLQPVKKGNLIVTAWGPEASDEIVINQIFN